MIRESGALMNAYEVLGVPVDATDRQIRIAFRRLSLTLHPDRPGGDAERFKVAAAAHTTLTDPEKRARYDAALRAERFPGPRIATPADRFGAFVRLAAGIVGFVELVQRAKREREQEEAQEKRRKGKR